MESVSVWAESTEKKNPATHNENKESYDFALGGPALAPITSLLWSLFPGSAPLIVDGELLRLACLPRDGDMGLCPTLQQLAPPLIEGATGYK